MSILTKEGIQKILNDDWLLMDECEGLENCTVIKELARMALAAMDSEPVAWMTKEQMQTKANIYRHDNDEGGHAWFDATEALWIEGYLSPVAFHHIFKPSEAGPWLDNEINQIEEDGRCAKSYREIRKGKTKKPVVVVLDNGRAIVWDGFHRIAAAVARNEPVYAIYAAPPAPVAVPDEKWVNPDIGYADENGFAEGWNACRAAMLNGGKS
ncbi:hypothetical protein ACFH1L_01720 [Klebsiella michiganensis]